MAAIKDNLESLQEKDIYSTMLFCLYRLIGTAEYSSLSELCYVLDKENLLNLCEYFGGQTIRIPTLGELENLIHALLLYQKVKIDRIPYEEAFKQLDPSVKDLPAIRRFYKTFCEVLTDYEFKVRDK